MIAASKDHGRIATLLLHAGADTATMDHQGMTALHRAAGGDHAQIAQALIDRSAPVDSQDNLGATPLHIAAGIAGVQVTEVLLHAEVDPNVRDDEGLTPLMIAASKDHARIVTLLLQAGADTAITDNFGNTALLLALSDSAARPQGLTESAEQLRAVADAQLRASLGVPERAGEVAVEAANSDNMDVLQVLLDAGLFDHWGVEVDNWEEDTSGILMAFLMLAKGGTASNFSW